MFNKKLRQKVVRLEDVIEHSNRLIWNKLHILDNQINLLLNYLDICIVYHNDYESIEKKKRRKKCQKNLK